MLIIKHLQRGGGYVTPNLCFVEETNGFVFKPIIMNGGGSEEPSVGDVAYYNNGKIKTVSISKWNTSLGTPIGVVVIPSNFLPDGKARILSLKAVDRNGNAATSHSYMFWGQSGNYVDTTLTNYTKVPITDNTSSTSSSSYSSGYLPSDNFAGSTSFVDSNAKYYTTGSNKIPSPYNGNVFNTDYGKEISGNNAFSDFNGLSNTQVLVGLGSDYTAANAAYNYNDGVSNMQWYLPSAGELGFLVARVKTINSTISQLGGVVVPSDCFWSSTEYSNSNVYCMDTGFGNVVNYFKDDYFFVRPFALLEKNNNGDGVLNFNLTLNMMEYEDTVELNYTCDLPDSSLYDLYVSNLIQVDAFNAQVDKNIIETHPISINNILVTNITADSAGGMMMADQLFLLNEKDDQFWGLSSEIESIFGAREYYFDSLILTQEGKLILSVRTL